MPQGWTPVQGKSNGWTPVQNDPLRDPSVPGYQRLEAAGMVQHAPEAPPVIEQIGTSLKNQAKGFLDMLSALDWANAPKTVAMGDQMNAHTAQNFQQAKDAYNKGDYSGAIAALGRSIPIIGGLIDKSSTDIVEGRAAEAATDVLAVPLIAKAIETGTPMVSDAIDSVKNTPQYAGLKAGVKAGGPKVAKGAVKVAAGEVADVLASSVGVPTSGGTFYGVLKGSKDIGEGLKVGRQAATDAAANFRRLQEGARIAALPDRPAPAWQSIPTTPTAPPETPPISSAPGTLPSGRKPGGIQNQVPTAADIAIKAGDVILPTDTVEIAATKLGYTGRLTAAKELEARVAIKQAAQAAEKAAPPASGPLNTPIPEQQAAKTNPVLNTPAKVDAAQALADELKKAEVSEPRITATNMFARPKPGQPKGPRPLPHDDLYNAIVSTSDANMFARDMGIGEAEAVKALADRGVLVLDRKALMKGLHDNFPGHQAMSDAALRKFGVKSTKELTDSQFAKWYDDVLVAQTEAADKRALKAQRTPAMKGAK